MNTNLTYFPGSTAPKLDSVISLYPLPVPSRPSNATARKGMKQEVYPFKSEEDIIAMQTYFLDQARKASSILKRNQHLRNFLYFSLSINIGYRGGDVIELKWGDVFSPDGSFITDPYHYIREEKTKKHRQLVINEDAQRAIIFYLNQTGIDPDPAEYIFPSQKGGHMELRPFLAILKSAAKAVGLSYNVGTHSLRKTFGYRYYKATNDLTTLQKIFNHSSPGITLAYIGITNEDIYNAYSKVNGAILPTEDLERMMAHANDSQANWFTSALK